jgi:excisionase family DNA binding protein/PAS domain S-box-containing protein
MLDQQRISNQQEHIMEKAFFSTPELAQWLGVFHTTIRRWVEQGKIKGIRVGRNYKIPAEEAARVLDDHEIPLPEILKTYKLNRKSVVQPLSRRLDGTGSILKRLLIVEEIEDPAVISRGDAILVANQAFADLAGYGQMDLIGADIAEVMGESSRKRLMSFAKRRLRHPGKSPSSYVARLKTDKIGEKKAKITVAALNHIRDLFLLIIKVD